MKKTLQIIIIILSIGNNLYSDTESKKWYFPDHYKTHFAGNTGFLSCGIGYSFFKGKYETDLFYGYVPKSISGNHIHTIFRKRTYKPIKITLNKNTKLTPILLGFNSCLVIGQNSFIILPEQYPESYYPPTAIYFAPFIGVGILRTDISKKRIKSLEFYFELGTIDRYLRNYFISDYLELKDILNISLGLKIEII